MAKVERNSSNTPAYSVKSFTTLAGNEPVRKWIDGLSADDEDIVETAISTLRNEWPHTAIATKMPGTGGLCEINKARKLSGNRSFRLFFCVAGAEIVLLDHCIKKSQKTEQNVLNRAKSRMRQHLARKEEER